MFRESRLIAASDVLDQKKSKFNALVVLFLFLFSITAIIYFDITHHVSTQSTYWPGPYTPIGVTLKNGSDPSVLRAELDYYTTLERYYGGPGSWGREGTIHVEGWIYNDGTEDVNVTLFLHVTDGTKSSGVNMSEFWQDYYFPMGVVTKNGGKKWFEWKQRYNPFDPTTATFFYVLLITK